MINSDIKNRVSHIFSIGGDSFYVMVHDCGEILLCKNEHAGGACRLDLASIASPNDNEEIWIVKYSREPKIDISNFTINDINTLIAETGIPFSYGMRSKNGNYDLVYERDYNSIAMRSTLTWANKHPKMAKYEYIAPVIESVRAMGLEPLSAEEYTGF